MSSVCLIPFFVRFSKDHLTSDVFLSLGKRSSKPDVRSPFPRWMYHSLIVQRAIFWQDSEWKKIVFLQPSSPNIPKLAVQPDILTYRTILGYRSLPNHPFHSVCFFSLGSLLFCETHTHVRKAILEINNRFDDPILIQSSKVQRSTRQ